MTAGDGDPLALPLHDFAQRRGCSRALIYKWIEQGRLHGPALRREGRKTMIVVAEAERQLAESADPAQARGGTLPMSDDSSYARQRARKTAAEAERAEIELRVRKGQLVERSAVAEVLGPQVRELRDAIIAAPRDTVKDDGDAAACEDALTSLLEEFATRLARLSMESTDDGGARPPG